MGLEPFNAICQWHIAATSANTGGYLDLRVPYPPHKDKIPFGILVFYFVTGNGARTIKMQYAGGILLPPVQTLVATLLYESLTHPTKTKSLSVSFLFIL